jgi:predicted RNA-binding Zn-ribbon protein involved in translation (DUF1610 family)
MPGIVLQTRAIEIQNHGGGFKQFTRVETFKHGFIEKRRHVHKVSKERQPGSDYVVFCCPDCGKRNRQSMYQVKGKAGESLSFKCNGCRREVEVSKPQEAIIVPGINIPEHTGLYGPNDKPLT